MSNSIVVEPADMGAHWLFMRLPLSFSLRPPSHRDPPRLDLRGTWLVMGSLLERET